MGKIFGILILIVSACSLSPDKKNANTTTSVRYNTKLKHQGQDVKADFPIRGYSLVAEPTKLDAQEVQPLLQTNVNWVAWSPYGFIGKKKSAVQYNSSRQWEGETTQGTSWAIKSLKEQDLKVLLKPHIWIGHGQFTGDFMPIDSLEWQNSYEKFILDFARIAEQERVEMFCIGTEMKATTLAYPKYFRRLIKKVRKVYKGQLTYAANWDEYTNVPFWKGLDWIGVDAYFPLSEKEKPTVADYKEGWEQQIQALKSFAEKNKKKILFTEVGYRNSLYNAKAPWAQDNKTICDSCQEQAYRGFTAAFQDQKDWFGGVFIWKYHFRPLQDDWVRFSPQNKPAGVYLQKAFKSDVK